MKLLPKKVVNSMVQDQKRAQIEEGVQLAHRVDLLRAKLADLEHQNELFIAGMQDQLRQKTKGYFSDIGDLQLEIKLLEAKRSELLKPLDFMREQLDTRESALNAKSLEIDSKLLEMARKEQVTNENKEKARETLNHINVRERELAAVYAKAQDDQDTTENIKYQIQKAKNDQDKLFEMKEKELNLREKSIESYEFTLQKKEEQLKMREQDNEVVRLQLTDQRKTLERALARTKKK